MLYDFEEINLILNQMVDKGTIEPIDDPSVEVNFWDWADVVGAIDDFVPEEYDHAQCDCLCCGLCRFVLHYYHCERLIP